jgi:hypothetical protein
LKNEEGLFDHLTFDLQPSKILCFKTNTLSKLLMTPCQTLKLCFSFLMLWGFMIIPLRAETYSDQLQDGLKLSYRHWNSEREEFTGYTHQEFQRVAHKGRQATLETQININSDGEETRRKSLCRISSVTHVKK